MTTIEFINFLAMFLIAGTVIRVVEILGRGTWLSQGLGAIYS